MSKREKDEHDKAFNAFLICIGILFIIIIILASRFTDVKAGVIGLDESVGGFSYVMDVLEGRKEATPDDLYNDIFQKIRDFTPPPIYRITPKEYDILVRIVEAEATGGNVEQKMNVVSCVLARVEAPQWPNDIYSVVFQKQQFTPVWDGRYYTVTITQSSKEAVDKVLQDGKTHDCLWFCSDDSYNKKNEKGEYCSYHRLHHTWVFFDDEHHYFYD